MGLWSKTIKRSEESTIRLEDDRTKMIEDFFSNQNDVVSYEIIDKKNFVVNIEGSLYLNEDDLYNGELFFKIGKLSGNMYCHFKHIKPALIPAELGGELVYVPDEEELWKNKQAANEDDPMGMGLLTTTAPSQEKVTQKITELISISISNGYIIDFEEIKRKLKTEWENREKYQLRVEIHKKKNVYNTYNLTCDVFVTEDDSKPLNLSAAEKAFYLAFIMMEEGVELKDITSDFINMARKIYSQLPEKVVKRTGGLMDENYWFSDNLYETINSHRKYIRIAIEEQISNRQIVDEFAVEGYKNQNVFVKRATPELRDEIRKGFGLQ